MENKIVKVIGCESVFKDYLGRYGRVLDKAYGDKWNVEFYAASETKGALIHTVRESDFEVVGEVI